MSVPATIVLSPATTATIAGATQRVDAGNLVLAQLEVPYATADVDIPLAWDANVEGLDPRTDVRVILNGSNREGETPRVANLGLRSREVDYAGKMIRLRLASDEALAQDYAALVEDQTPLTFQGSIRALVNYVIGKVLPGTVLEPGNDKPIPALAASQNLVRNPSVGVNTTDWYGTWTTGGFVGSRKTTGGPSYAPTYYEVWNNVAATTGGYVYLDQTKISLAPNETYELSVDVRSAVGQAVGIDGLVFDSAGNPSYWLPNVGVNGSGNWRRATMQFTTGPNAAQLRPRVTFQGTFAYGGVISITAWRLSKSTGDRVADAQYFDGGTPDTSAYDHSWQEAAHASVSNRRVIPASYATPKALVWSPGVTAWDFLSPILVTAGWRLFCDELRKWRLVDPATYVISGVVTGSGFVTVEGTDTITREDSEIFSTGVVVRYVWTDDAGRAQTQTEAAGTPNKVFVIEYQRPYPGPGAAAAILVRRNGSGRVQALTMLADWKATPGMDATVSMPQTPRQDGRVTKVTFDLGDDALMSLETVALIDIPPASWAAVPDTEKWTDPPDLTWDQWV